MFKKGMIRFRRKMAAVLAAAMLFSSYPVPAYAAGGPDGALEYLVGEEGQTDGLVSADEADSVSEDGPDTVSADETDTVSEDEAGTVSTDEVETVSEDEPDTVSGDEAAVISAGEILPVLTDDIELLGSVPEQNSEEPSELYFDEFSYPNVCDSGQDTDEIEQNICTASYYINSPVCYNGFTIYDSIPTDDDPGMNKIKIYQGTSEEAVPVLPVSKNATDAYLRFNDATPFEHTYISFQTAVCSDVVVVAKFDKHYFPESDPKADYKVYLKDDDDIIREAVIPVSKDPDVYKPSTVVFKTEAGKTYKISADRGVAIYFVKVLPSEAWDYWDFWRAPEEDEYGNTLYEDIPNKKVYLCGRISEISGTTAYIYGLIFDTTTAESKINDPYENGIRLCEASVYVPVRENRFLKIDASKLNIEVNGDCRKGSMSTLCDFDTFMSTDGGSDRPGYTKIWGDCDFVSGTQLNYIRFDDASTYTVSFKNGSETVYEVEVPENHQIPSLETKTAMGKLTVPEGKVFTWWSETENGEPYNLTNLAVTGNKTLFPVFKDAVPGEFSVGNINNEELVYTIHKSGWLYFLKDASLSYNGFILYDKTPGHYTARYADSANRIRIHKSSTPDSICIASAGISACDGYLYSGGGDPELQYFSIKTTEDSEVAVVVKRHYDDLIFMEEGGDAPEAAVLSPGKARSDKNSVVIFKAQADKTYQLTFEDNYIYFIKVMPVSQTTAWDLTSEDILGVLGEEVSGSAVYIDGLYVDTTEEGAKIQKYDDTSDRMAKGLKLEQGTVIYVPIHDKNGIRINVPNGYANILVNGKAMTAAEELLACSDTASGKPGYIKIEAKNGAADLKKIELTDICTVSFNVAGTDIHEVIVSQNAVLSSADLQAAEDKLTAPAGKEFYGWYEDPDCTGDAFDINIAITEDITLYGRWKAKLDNDSVSVDELTYSGSAQYPDVYFVTGDSTKKLIKDTDYTISFTIMPLHTGTYKAVITGIGNYIGDISVPVTVVPKAVTVSADDVTKTFGDDDPKLTYKVNGLCGTDTLADVTLSRRQGENVGEYTINVSVTAKSNPDYSVTVKTGTFKIQPSSAKITVTVTGHKESFIYDGTAHTMSGTQTSVQGDQLFDMSCDNASYSLANISFNGIAVPSKTDAGNYALGLKAELFSNTDANYSNVEFIVTDGYLKIDPKAVTIKAENKSKTYGTADPVFTASVNGLIGNDTVAYTLSREEGENVGNYVIIPSAEALQGNYSVSCNTGVFTINKAQATVTKAPQAKTGLIYSGAGQELINAAEASGGTIKYSVNGGAYIEAIPEGLNAGSYSISYKVFGDSNYEESEAGGPVNVTIARAAAVVSANDAVKAYGAADPSYTATVSGTFGSDVLSYTFSREEGENVGRYVITPAGAAEQGNYTVTYKSGILTIDAYAFTPEVTLSQNSYTYDGTEKKPAVTVKNGSNEIASSAYTVKYANNTNAGTADVTVSANSGGNYSFDEVTVHFTINKAPINPVVAMADFAQGSEAGTPVVTGNPGNGAVTFLYKVKDAADSTYTDTIPSTEGSYTISANIAETDNYLGGYATDDFNILKEAAAVTTVPAANSLTYTGSAQALVSAGAATGGTIKYAKGSSEAPAESFSESIPTEINAGTYYVWYKAFGDENHTDSAMGSVMVVISKASQAAPEAPTKKSSTTSSITLTAYNGYEYCLSGHSWQSSNTFSGLNADTEYTFFQRISGDANHEASPASAAATFRTDALPTEDKPTPTDKVGPTPSENVTPTPSENATPTPTGEADPTPTGEDTPTPTVTVTPTPTAGPVPTYAPSPTPIPVPEEPAEMSFVFANGTDTFSTEYTGSAIKPEILGYCGSRLLAEGKDYTVSYSRNTAAGTAKVSIIGKNGYEGKYSLEFTIAPKRIDDNGAPAEGIIVSGLTVQGDAAVKPVLIYNGVQLGTDKYSVTSGEASDGTETVTITAKNKNFTGEIKDLPVTRIKDKAEFEKTSINVKLEKIERVYDGTPKLLGSELTVTDQEGKLLGEGTDYKVSYSSDVINAGKVKATIMGIGNYTGSKKVSYKIAPAKDAAIAVQLVPEEGMPAGSYSYSKNKVTPAVFVTASEFGLTNVLAEGIDYTVKYSKNSKPGATGTIKLTFKGNYKGAKAGKINFTIEKAGFKDAEIFVSDLQYAKPGNYKVTPVITVNGEVVAKSQYTLSYSISGAEMPGKFSLKEDETEALITVTATSRGKGFKENDTISATYRVYKDGKTDVSKAKVTLVEKDGSKKVSKLGYTGNPITFSPDNKYRQADIQVKIGDTVLTGAEVFNNFDVIYADNVKKGKATMILTAKEDSPYSGMCSGSFKIVKRKVK